MNVFELTWYSAEQDASNMVKGMGKWYEDSVMAEVDEKTCPNCGKTSEIQVFTVIGWRDHEEAHCPVCGRVVASDMCFKISANLKKVF